MEHEVDYSAFSQEILDDLPHLPWSIPADEIQRRRDFRFYSKSDQSNGSKLKYDILVSNRDHCIFTIDPSDARDLDDAVCGRFLKMAEDGITRLYEVSVHIADVSYFVQENTLLDGIASRRATSTYLVDRVCILSPSYSVITLI